MALTVGVATVLDSREVVVVVTGQRKALALSKAIGACPCRRRQRWLYAREIWLADSCLLFWLGPICRV